MQIQSVQTREIPLLKMLTYKFPKLWFCRGPCRSICLFIRLVNNYWNELVGLIIGSHKWQH